MFHIIITLSSFSICLCFCCQSVFYLGLACGIALAAMTAVYASDTIQAVRQVFINGKLLNTNVQITDDGTTMTSTRTLAEALGAKVSWNGQSNTVEIENLQYSHFVSSLLHRKYSFKYEIIADNIINNPDTTGVFSEGYKDIPDNTDFQKLFLLLLIEQIGDLKTKKIEFWSNIMSRLLPIEYGRILNAPQEELQSTQNLLRELVESKEDFQKRMYFIALERFKTSRYKRLTFKILQSLHNTFRSCSDEMEKWVIERISISKCSLTNKLILSANNLENRGFTGILLMIFIFLDQS